MNAAKVLAIALIVLGALGLVYGGFSYTSARHRAEIGSLHMEVDEHERVNIPLWVGIAAIAGGAILLTRTRKS